MDAPSQNALHNLQHQSGLQKSNIGRLIAQDAAVQWQDFLRGLWLYQHHNAERIESDWRIVTQTHAVALKRLAPLRKKSTSAVLLIPSLINRFHILDLHPTQSFAQFLQAQGHDVYLLDWHHDTAQHLPAILQDCVDAHILPALDALPQKPHVISYCMGGTLSILTAAQQANRMHSLTLLATPWDFHEPDSTASKQFGQSLKTIDYTTASGHVSAEWLQMLFWQHDSLAALRKFRQFAQMAMPSDQAARFVLAEDWLNNGVDLPVSLLEDCAENWFNLNKLVTTDLKKLNNLPVHIINAARDRLVPVESSRALQKFVRHAHSEVFDTGHIGLFAGANSQAVIWPQVQQFLAGHNS